jgi:hypothetical protein
MLAMAAEGSDTQRATAFASLAFSDPDNIRRIWADDTQRAVIVAGAAAGQPDVVRQHAMQIMRNVMSTSSSPSSSRQIALLVPDLDAAQLVESIIGQLEALPEVEMQGACPKVSFKGQVGSDSGGLSRELFARFGQAMERAPAESAAPEAGATDEASRKRQRVDNRPRLWKSTAGGALVPSSAETLMGRVGDATDAEGAVVPSIPQHILQRYRACGRLCGLALNSGCPLGMPLATYFIRLLQAATPQPPETVEELQSLLASEDEVHYLARPCFLRQQLSDQGLGSGVLTMERQVTVPAHGGPSREASTEPVATPVRVPLAAPLSADPECEVTDDNKESYLKRTLTHQLHTTIAQQAAAFRAGVYDVLRTDLQQLFGALTPIELRNLWCGHSLDDEQLARWRQSTVVEKAVAQQAEWFWAWLNSCTADCRARVLQFATGSLRLPRKLNFRITQASDPITIAPTPSNGLHAPCACASSATCGPTLSLPLYQSSDELSVGMELSMQWGEGYGLA